MDKVVALCKRRGFIYPSSEIYGGISGFWDYGPLGVELKKNIKNEWWKSMVQLRDDVVGIDASIIMNPEVWKVSGHIEAFTDPLVECKHCHKRFREDHLRDLRARVPSTGVGSVQSKKEFTDLVYCKDGRKHEWMKPRNFNLLMEVMLGTVDKNMAYLRGEITQGAFVNFQNVVDSTRVKIPFGIAQIGKAFRNEITPGNFTYRSREFEQMELEYFIQPNDKEGQKWFEYWKKQRMDWYVSLGMNKQKLRFRPHEQNEKAHYAKKAEDIEYQAPFGWAEFEGIHHRGDWDLSRHKLTYKDPDSGEEYTPWVIETSGGVDRSSLFFLLDSYSEQNGRTILRLHPKLAPYKVGVFPLVSNKAVLVDKAKKIYNDLRGSFTAAWDDRGNIGKRYASQDEIGTPFCITVDYETLEKDSVTIRERDSAKQERIPIEKIPQYLQKKLL